jgi:hypothetical protein
MLFPRFTLRLILLLNAVLAVIFLVAKYAVDGHAWAIGAILGVLSAGLLMAIFGLLFMAAYAFSFAYWLRRKPQTESPFATDKLPPQVIPPRHIDD